MSSLLSPPSVRGGEDSAEIALKASMEQKPIYINNFTGQAENPNVGSGVYVGIDLFTTKTVARLSRKMQKKSGSVVTDLPIYFTTANNGYIYCQDEAGKIYVSVNQGDSWSVVTGNSGDDGKGLIVWQDYLFSFTPDDIDIYGPFSGAPSWTNGWWTDAGGANQPALSSLVGVNHYPYNDPAQASIMYFCNNNKICSIELSGSGAAFDPADSSTYVANESKFVMQDFYNAKVIGYLPPSSIAIGVENRLNAQADAVIWDGVQNTTAINVVTVPGASNPITQMITRNGVLYCVTDKEHGVYILNGGLCGKLKVCAFNKFFAKVKVYCSEIRHYRLARTRYRAFEHFCQSSINFKSLSIFALYFLGMLFLRIELSLPDNSILTCLQFIRSLGLLVFILIVKFFLQFCYFDFCFFCFFIYKIIPVCISVRFCVF